MDATKRIISPATRSIIICARFWRGWMPSCQTSNNVKSIKELEALSPVSKSCSLALLGFDCRYLHFVGSFPTITFCSCSHRRVSFATMMVLWSSPCDWLFQLIIPYGVCMHVILNKLSCDAGRYVCSVRYRPRPSKSRWQLWPATAYDSHELRSDCRQSLHTRRRLLGQEFSCLQQWFR